MFVTRYILVSMLFFSSFPCFSAPITCILKGEVSGRNSKAIILSKATDHRFAEKVRIPIKDNRFNYSFIAAHEEMYQLVFEDEWEKGSWFSIKFFPFEGNVHLKLYPEREWLKNEISGGRSNEEYYSFFQNYWGAFLPRFDALNKEVDDLRKSDEYYSPPFEKLRVELKEMKDNMEAKQVVYQKMDELKNMGQDLTEKGLAIKMRIDSVVQEQIEWRYKYIREYLSLPSYFLLMQDLSLGKSNRQIANNIAELYPRFATAFPDHVYTPRVRDELTGLMRIRPGETYIDLNLPDLQEQIHSLSKTIEDKVALIDFWGSWCGPCIVKSRKMVPNYNKYKDKGFTIVGIAREYKNTKELKKRLAIEKWGWLQLLEMDDKNNTWNKYGISEGTGMLVLIDKQGKILAVDPTPEEVEKFLKRLL